jgi:hypothetical protein
VSATALAARVAELYLPPRPASAQATGAAAAATGGVTGLDVSARAGLFFDERTGEPMRLQANDGRLRIANGPALVTLAADRFRNARGDLFFRSQDEFELRFVSDDRLEIRSMEGQTTRYRRAQPWTPSAADLQAVAGRYESRELGATFEIVPGANGLVLRAERTPDRRIDLAPAERDTYMQRMMFVRFRRDAGGRVVGFDYGNPLVRGLAFTRLGSWSAAAPATPPAMAAEPPTAPPTAPGAAPRLEQLVGEYELAPGRTVAITLEDGRLHGQPPGGARRPLAHVSGATFAAGGGPLTLTFTLGADGRATALVMRQNGDARTLPRVR